MPFSDFFGDFKFWEDLPIGPERSRRIANSEAKSFNEQAGR
jgi:hypothetical protein